MAFNTGRTGWNERGRSALDEIAAGIDYQMQLHDANSFYWENEARAAMHSWDNSGVDDDTWQAFRAYFRAHVQGGSSFREWHAIHKIALETFERHPGITAEAIAHAAGILPDECDCKLPDEHCPACEAVARRVYGSGEALEF